MMRTLLALLALAGVATCEAVTTGARAPDSGSATRPAPARHEATATMVDDSAGLRRGVLEKVDHAQGTFQVHGQPLQFDAAKVRIFGRDGKSTNAFALRKGGTVHFTLDASDPMKKRVAVIYVE